MLETVYSFSLDDQKGIEKLADADPVMINPMVLPKGEGIPEHDSNSNVYMLVIRGNMTLKLDEQEPHVYPGGRIIYFPYRTKMRVDNHHDGILESFRGESAQPQAL